jgi:hypothetical protein
LLDAGKIPKPEGSQTMWEFAFWFCVCVPCTIHGRLTKLASGKMSLKLIFIYFSQNGYVLAMGS